MKHKIKGDIVSWNSSIWDFNQKMQSIKEDEDIELEINSYGGDVFMGIDLMNTLRSHPGNVTATITGIAASAASVIVMGADKIRAYSNTQLMLHNAWTVAMGNSKELRKVADDLESINESVLASYTHRIDADQAKTLLDNESYLSASKAKDLGLVDEIVDGQPETVDSTIFENKAKEFNNQITNDQPEPILTEDMVKSMIASVEEKLRNELKQKEPEQVPAAASAKRNLSKLFLHL